MNRQLHLLPATQRSHRISEETKAVGRRGIAQARAALLAARTGNEPAATTVARPANPTPHSHSRMRAQQRKTAA